MEICGILFSVRISPQICHHYVNNTVITCFRHLFATSILQMILHFCINDFIHQFLWLWTWHITNLGVIDKVFFKVNLREILNECSREYPNMLKDLTADIRNTIRLRTTRILGVVYCSVVFHILSLNPSLT